MDNSSLDRDLGRLEGKVDRIIAAQERSYAASVANRQETQDFMDDVANRLTSVEHRVAGTERSIEKIEPFIEKAERWEQRGVGALAAVGMISGSIGALATAFWGYVKGYLV